MTWWLLVGIGIGVVISLVTFVVLEAKDRPETVAEKQLVQIDRNQLAQLLALMERLAIAVDVGGATGLRIEEAAGVVADDLAMAHRRADEESGPPGSAADAFASQTTEEMRR